MPPAIGGDGPHRTSQNLVARAERVDLTLHQSQDPVGMQDQFRALADRDNGNGSFLEPL